jgi:DNA-binding protein H-NS
MSIDLSKLSLPELYTLEKQIKQEIPRRQSEERANTLAALKQMAAERGFNLNDLIGGSSKGGPRGPVSAKYRSVDGQEWSGRGRKPGWVVSHLEQGGKLEDLAV